MAENIDVNVNVNTSQANRNLDNLKNRIGLLNRSFTALKTALGGIAFGSLISSSLRFADSVDDISNATGLAIPNVLGFSRAVQENGGSMQDAEAAMTKFVQTIGEAAEGSAKTQEAFAKVGVTLNDLRTQSEQALFNKVINGLGQISDRAQKARVANELFGKSLRGVDLDGLAGGYDNAVRRSIQYTEAIKKGAQVSQNLETALADIKLVLLQLLTPLSELARSISENIDGIMKWTKVVFAFLQVIAGFFIFVRVAIAIRAGYLAIKNFVQGLKDGYAAWQNLKRLFGNSTGTIQKAIEKAKELGETNLIAKKVLDSWKLITENAKNAAVAVGGFIATIFGLKAAYDALKASEPDFNKPLVIQGEGAMPIPENYFEKRREQLREIQEALRKEKAAIAEVTAAYQRNNAEQLANINIQRLSLDMSRDEVEVMNAVDEVIKRNEEAIRRLREQKEGLASDSPLIPAIEKEIKILEDSLETDKRVTAEAVRNLQARQLQQEKLNHVLEQTNIAISQGASLQALQDQLSLVGQYGQELENNLVRLDVQRELESTLNGLAVRALELEQQRVQLGEARYQQEINNLLALTDAAYKYADARLDAEKKILEAQRAVQQNAKLGTEQAMADIQKQFEPYQMAQDAVKQGWNRVSDALDTFVDTGKLKFSDLARSVIADLTKMILKAMIFKAISGLAGAFGLSIPGLAKGGPAKSGQPYIVGEKGPELFVPQSSGTVVPNNKLNKGVASGAVNAPVTNNYITNNISAIDAKGVAQLFAENRKTLLGSVKMAEREMPYMAR